MWLLFVFLFIALFFSFLCSILEAMLLSVTPAFASALINRSPKRGKRLLKLKEDIDRPLAAILSLNTIAHTVGAAGVGAQAAVVFGSAYVGITSAILTLLILVLSEIIPKTLGALYWRQLAIPGALVIEWLIWIMYPLVFFSQEITKLLSGKTKVSSISREEFRALTDLGEKEGIFFRTESKIFKNLMRFSSLKAKHIMTPRTVLFTLSEELTIGDIQEGNIQLRFSRIPIYKREKDNIRYYVLKNDILLATARSEHKKSLYSLGREILVLPELIALPGLFERMLNQREYIALMVDEHGGVSGVVTMEDVLETILGIEIVDETDEATDMQQLARRQWEKRAKKLGLIPDSNTNNKSK